MNGTQLFVSNLPGSKSRNRCSVGNTRSCRWCDCRSCWQGVTSTSPAHLTHQTTKFTKQELKKCVLFGIQSTFGSTYAKIGKICLFCWHKHIHLTRCFSWTCLPMFFSVSSWVFNVTVFRRSLSSSFFSENNVFDSSLLVHSGLATVSFYSVCIL